MKCRILTAALLVMGLNTAQAEEYMFTYSKLYSPLKHNLKEPQQDVKVGLFFTNFKTKQPCSIEKAWMEKEEHYEKLSISENGEVNVPLDSNLKSANPLVYIYTEKEARCDYSLVVLTKEPLSGEVGYFELESKTLQMKSVLGGLGGMFSSWFTPDIEGVTLEFTPDTVNQISLSNGKSIPVNEQGKAILKLTDLSDGVTADISQETQRVMPYIEQ
ncbi:hypothetical protein VIN01S_16890 [Vibrio inusitatus NBRC 102082]|uniref:DUF2987 domain-containing protein n=1 Tax=Vibrio inusitatus NBRC 102082 TaxID=1219070 RepID=A0A4Y3HV74_9VIBR|nr:DUF2987 domain-containing protein [Vibrio inusitatus]GEA50885.1 hypothetical protein VIN01S_16890 [Vibrio inusitatus NBRC 102082]